MFLIFSCSFFKKEGKRELQAQAEFKIKKNRRDKAASQAGTSKDAAVTVLSHSFQQLVHQMFALQLNILSLCSFKICKLMKSSTSKANP
jgi:hypothetical protein